MALMSLPSRSACALAMFSGALLPTTLSASTANLTSGMPAFAPLRGIAYGALPCKAPACSDIIGVVSEDMVQEAYAPQWGPKGRNDLGVMARLGANAVRLYHSLGLEMNTDHGGFLDHAEAVGLNVMPGYHTYMTCPEYNCFEPWKKATLEGFKFGYKKGDSWHPAIAALILLNEPDFFGGPKDRVRVMLSALDGVLAAEREAGVAPGRVKLTVTWSFGMRESVDGKLVGPGTFGFQDTVAGIADPQIADYTPVSTREELQEAFRTRWVHGMNVQDPWSFVKAVVLSEYQKRFAPIPWFIGEYGANGQEAATIQADLEEMQSLAEEEGSGFLGAAFFQYQTAYFKDGPELNFGIFSLGEERLGDITAPIDKEACPSCNTTWPVYCLGTNLSWLPGTMADRAEAVAAAWHGSLGPSRAFCQGRRLGAAAAKVSTQREAVAEAQMWI